MHTVAQHSISTVISIHRLHAAQTKKQQQQQQQKQTNKTNIHPHTKFERNPHNSMEDIGDTRNFSLFFVACDLDLEARIVGTQTLRMTRRLLMIHTHTKFETNRINSSEDMSETRARRTHGQTDTQTR